MEDTTANVYAVAKALNERITAMIVAVVVADSVGLPEDQDIHELNRAYVLLGNELQKLYNRTPELAAIKPEPIWKRFDVIRTSSWEINQHLSENSVAELNAHNARVEKLCIVAGVEEPSYSPDQKKLIEYAETTTSNYVRMIDDVSAKKKAEKENDWHIPEYTLIYKQDGSILVNNVLKLKKAHAGSTTERLLEQAIKRPNELFKPDLGQTSRNLSTVLSSAGFTSTLRELFFPTVSKSKGVVFRPTVTRTQADEEKINTTELDLKLKELGAATEPKTA
jgi:hypothetical protein